MRKKLLIIAALISVVVLVVCIWPSPSYDIARVHPRLRGLRTPYQSVSTDYYLDGGSVGVEIVDRDGYRLQAALPVSSGPGDRRYDRVFLGVMHLSQTGAVDVAEVVIPEHSKRMLIRIIDAYSPHGPDRDAALFSLRGTPRDYVHVGRHMIYDWFSRK